MKDELYKKLEKIVVNVGIGRQSQEPNFAEKKLPAIIDELAMITGQKPSPRPAKKSIAGFKTRAGTVVGLKVTLRRKRMKHFFERLVHVVLPRVRDFRGIDQKAIDGSGNLSIGIKDHLVFPEIIPENSKVNFGVQVTVVPCGLKNRDAAVEVYKALKVPFKKPALKSKAK
jgi:large subunit ribosomal protein L5